MSLVRRLALAAGALLGLLALVLGVLVATFDAERATQAAVDCMHTHHRRTLAVEGPVALAVFPRLAVTAKGLRLSEAGRPDEFLRADEVALAVRAWPLLRGQVAVDHVQARGVLAAWHRDAQGASNIDDFIGRSATGPAPAGPASAPGAGPAVGAFEVRALRIEDLRLALDDRRAGMVGEVHLRRLDAGRVAPGVATALTLDARVALTQPQPLALDLDGRATLTPDPASGTLTVGGLALQVKGDAAGLQGLSARVEGDLLSWAGQTLSARRLALVLNEARQGPRQLGPARLQVERLKFAPAEQRLELDALQLALVGRQGEQRLETTLAAPRLVVDRQNLGGDALAGTLRLDGPLALQGQFESAAPEGGLDALRLPGLALKLSGKARGRAVDLQARADALRALAERSVRLDALRLDGKLDGTLGDAGRPPLGLDVHGQASASASAGAVQWSLQGQIADNRFDSRGSAAFDGKVPQLKAQARFDQLDLNALAGRLAPAPGPAPAPAPAASASTQAARLPWEVLDALAGQFGITAGQLAVRQVRVGDARVEASLEQGTLRVARLAGRVWGGSVEARGSLQARGQRVAIDLDARGIDAQALLKDLASRAPIEGTGQLRAELQSSGADFDALRRGLAGSASLRLHDGAVKGVDLARALRQAKAALRQRPDAMLRASASEKTDFSELSASARIAGGVAESNDLDLKSPYLRVNGAGRIDIGRGRVDYLVRATLVDTAKGQGGAELAALQGVMVPVRLSGPLDAITWEIQWSQVAAAALQKELERRLSRRLQGGRAAAPPAGAASAPAKPEELLKRKLEERLQRLLR